jgi:TerC family integral membrane protein
MAMSSSDKNNTETSSFQSINNGMNTNTNDDGSLTTASAAVSVFSEDERAYLFVEDEVALGDIYEVAVRNTLAWVALASLFGFVLSQAVSVKTAEEFFAGYLVEQSLSIDNLFVFLVLFDYFKVPTAYQNRVLSWGIGGAVVMRGIMIGLGAAALQKYHAILLVFASFLVYSGVSTLKEFAFSNSDDDEEDDADVSEDLIVKFSKKLFDSVDYFDGDRFFTLVDGVKKATPLLLCMVAVEISDVVFAVDSIPAVFGVTEVRL